MTYILTAFLLGILMLADPCTLFTSVAAVGYIDRELRNKRRILVTGTMFALGKIVTYVLLAVPFVTGARTAVMRHFLHEWAEPLLAAFMLLCGILLLVTGHHHQHDHGMTRWLQSVDERSNWFWAFMLGIFFSIAFCPHRLVYFFTMIDIAVSLPLPMTYLLPLVFGVATALPILLIAWAISYKGLNTQRLTAALQRYAVILRYCCAVLFIVYGLYLAVHIFAHELASAHDCPCGCTHHVESSL